MATTGSGPHVGRVLELKSPFGEETITYKWPLKKGKGSVRRSEVSFIDLVDLPRKNISISIQPKKIPRF